MSLYESMVAAAQDVDQQAKLALIEESSGDIYNDILLGTGLIASDGTVYSSQDIIDAFNDDTKQIIYDDNNNPIDIQNLVDPVDTSGSGGTLGEVTNGTGTDTTVEAPVTTVEAPVTTIDENGTGGGTLTEATNQFPNFDPNAPIYDSPVQSPEGGGAGGVAQNPTISIAGSLYDYDGNYVGSDPSAVNVGGSLYDRQGSYLGPAEAGAIGATGGTIGGASSDNVIFDAYTAEQEAAQAKAAEAVELMDAGYGRYNAAIRKLGIVGRQGEEYAPLILDQLRMAEQEAAQPQLAAFGFGLNPQLGGMPQIGVQGVQGNTGGQSALTAMSNAGLNQLQLAQQPYNRIALPAIDSATGQPDFSQVNNPTIFKASTNV